MCLGMYVRIPGGIARTIAVRSESLLSDWNIITNVSRPPKLNLLARGLRAKPMRAHST